MSHAKFRPAIDAAVGTTLVHPGASINALSPPLAAPHTGSEDANITALFSNNPPDMPAGYNFDYVNADALINRLAVSGGLIAS
jgi:hypothetical protein